MIWISRVRGPRLVFIAALAVGLGVAGDQVRAQGPPMVAPIPPMPAPMIPGAPPIYHYGPGPVAGAAHHVGRVLKDNLIGYPEYFIRPPLGGSLTQNFGTMKARADMHSFILYRSDFIAETGELSPTGASRLNRMIGKLPLWAGPIVIERVPDRPGLAERRREGLLTSLGHAGQYVDPGRVLVGGSPYDGLYGDMANSNFDAALFRHQAATIALPLPPLPVAQIQPSQ
ncbi:hypothetical protein BH23PLA1_BH23PLA1_44870 [soil metagenome]